MEWTQTNPKSQEEFSCQSKKEQYHLVMMRHSKPALLKCGGVKNGQCVFTVSQNICVEIPVEFGTTATVGDAYVDCVKASADDIYTDCYNYVPETN